MIGSANSSNTVALAKVATTAGCPIVLRIDGPEELDLAALGDASVVGVTAGASAPEDLVEQVIEHLAPTDGVELVNVTDEDEYFPPPRELRELLPTLVALLAGAPRRQPGPGARELAARRPLPRRVDRPRRPRPLTPTPTSAQSFGLVSAGRAPETAGPG